VESCGVAKDKIKKTKKPKKLVKFKRIKSLKCFKDVEEMLYAGFPIAAIANFIQKNKEESLDITRDSLIQSLVQYHTSLKPAGLICHTLPRTFAKAETKFANKMKELERLETQYRAAEYRFDLAHGKERMGNYCDPEVSKLQKLIIEIIAKQHAVKMDLGLIGSRDLGTITVSAERVEYIRNKYGEGAARAFDDPVSRGRVLAALSSIRRAGKLREADGSMIEVSEKMNLTDDESKIIDVEYEETGETYEVGPMEKVVMDPDEDFSKPIDDMGEAKRVEKKTEPEPRDEPMVREPLDNDSEMAIIRNVNPNLPPGPQRPALRVNRKKVMVSTPPVKKQ